MESSTAATIRAKSTIVADGEIKIKEFEFSRPSRGNLIKQPGFINRHGIIYDPNGAPLPISFLSMPRQTLEASLKSTVGSLFTAGKEQARPLGSNVYVPFLLPGYWNYYHLLIDMLPRVLVSLTLGDETAKILVHKDQTNLLHTRYGELFDVVMRSFNIDQYIEIFDDEFVKSEFLVVPKASERFAAPAFGLFQDCAAQFDGADPSRRIYISRSLTSARRILNEDKVISILSKYGFVNVNLEKMTFPDQVKLFRNSEIVVGAHGAGFSNILFARPGTRFVEFLQRKGLYKALIFSELAAIGGCDHTIIVSSDEVNATHPGSAGNMHMTVDCNILERTLDRLLA